MADAEDEHYEAIAFERTDDTVVANAVPPKFAYCMNRLATSLVFLASTFSLAAPCPDANLRVARIGGDVIGGAVELKHKPLKLASVRLYYGDKLIWHGATDKRGRFEIDHLGFGEYWLVVSGWGSANVEIKSGLSLTCLHQRPTYNLLLLDDECIATIEIIN